MNRYPKYKESDVEWNWPDTAELGSEKNKIGAFRLDRWSLGQ